MELQALRDVLNYSSNTDWIGITPTMTKYSFTVDEKLSIGEQNINTFQLFDIFSHFVTEDFVNMTVL